jgi:hypothetical protein
LEKTFYWGGCSFTYGGELKKPLETRFSKLVSDNFQAKELNYAQPGGSNHLIVRRFVDNISKQDFDFVFIMWTSVDRFEYWTGEDADRDYDGFEPVSIHRLTQVFPPKRYRRRWESKRQQKNALLNYSVKIRTDEHKIAILLQQILTVQTICKAKNIPCIMSFHRADKDAERIEKIINKLEQTNPQAYEFMIKKYNLIDWSDTQWLVNNQFSFYSFAKENNYKIGKHNHPLEKAHEKISQLIISQIGEQIE